MKFSNVEWEEHPARGGKNMSRGTRRSSDLGGVRDKISASDDFVEQESMAPQMEEAVFGGVGDAREQGRKEGVTLSEIGV